MSNLGVDTLRTAAASPQFSNQTESENLEQQNVAEAGSARQIVNKFSQNFESHRDENQNDIASQLNPLALLKEFGGAFLGEMVCRGVSAARDKLCGNGNTEESNTNTEGCTSRPLKFFSSVTKVAVTTVLSAAITGTCNNMMDKLMFSKLAALIGKDTSLYKGVKETVSLAFSLANAYCVKKGVNSGVKTVVDKLFSLIERLSGRRQQDEIPLLDAEDTINVNADEGGDVGIA